MQSAKPKAMLLSKKVSARAVSRVAEIEGERAAKCSKREV